MLGGHTIEQWLIFHAFIAFLLILDLGVLNRKSHVVHLKEAVLWSIFWILLGLGFGAYIYFTDSEAAGIQYVTGYIVEKSLSVDNLFVFLVIFEAFQIQRQYQHRLLFWGIIGAIILRGIMIALGAQLIDQFHWVIYVFGFFLVWTGYKMLRGGAGELDPLNTPVFKLLKRYFPISTAPYTGRFFVTEGGVKKMSYGFAALIVVEFSDVLFAVDSIPAVFGVTRDPYLVYTSNIFAIMGLRSLFFVLEDMLHRFTLLKYGLGIILAFVGVKMLIEHWYKIDPVHSLMVIGVILTTSILLSLRRNRASK
jgi:tellurite resistance protein TerC